MTYGENKKLTLALIEEYAPNVTNLTEDEDIALRLPYLYDLAYKELAMVKKIIATKIYQEISDENKTDSYTAYIMPANMYQIKNVFALDSNNKKIEADYNIIGNKIYISNETPGNTILEYYKYPMDINSETEDDFYLEINADAQSLLPYKVADDILKSDPSANYQVFANEYQRKLQQFDARRSVPTVELQEPDYDI